MFIKSFSLKVKSIRLMKKVLISLFCSIILSCAPPLEDKCFSTQMDNWESAVTFNKDDKKYRVIVTENLDGSSEEQFYPDTVDGKTVFQSRAWSKCTEKVRY